MVALYIWAPPIIKISLVFNCVAVLIAALIVITKVPPFTDKSCLLEITVFSRSCKHLPNDSNVFRPITTGIAQVVFLKNLVSFGNFQSNSLFLPIALFVEAATINEIYIGIK